MISRVLLAKEIFSKLSKSSSVLVGTVALLTSCGPSSGSAPAGLPLASPLKFAKTSPETADCEAQIRKQMVAHEIHFSGVAAISSEIARANQAFASAKKDSFSISVKAQQPQEVSVATEHASGGVSVGLSVGEAAKSLSLDIGWSEAEVQRSLRIEQRVMVSAECEAKVTSTTLVKTEGTKQAGGETAYHQTTSVYYFNGETKVSEVDFNLPKGQVLNSMKSGPDDGPSNSTSAIYIANVGLADLKQGPLETRTVQAFDRTFHFEGIEMSVTPRPGQGGATGTPKTLMTMFSGRDAKEGVDFTDLFGQQKFSVPQELWKTVALGTSESSFGVKSRLGSNYLASNSSYILESSHRPPYEHADAYWKIQELKGSGSKRRFLLSENLQRTYKDTVQAADLVSNSTIQTNLPKIQEVKTSIAKATSVRRERIALILKYLKENYKYDLDMLANNVVRPLTTQEALDRGQGVCQHYAVIFTAIARALEIPSRIVVGYLLTGDAPGGHAWVEVEVAPGIWQAVEPQQQDALTNMHIRYYFPTARATFLEDKNANMLEAIEVMVNGDFVLLPKN